MSHGAGYWSGCLRGLLAVYMNTQTVKFRISPRPLGGLRGQCGRRQFSVGSQQGLCVHRIFPWLPPLRELQIKAEITVSWHCLVLSLHLFLHESTKKLF